MVLDTINPVDFGELFSGVGSLALSIMVIFIIWRLSIPVLGLLKALYNRESKYSLLAECFLDRFAEKKGIDLNKEMLKKKILETEPRNLRRKLDEEIFKEMFDKTEERE